MSLGRLPEQKSRTAPLGSPGTATSPQVSLTSQPFTSTDATSPPLRSDAAATVREKYHVAGTLDEHFHATRCFSRPRTLAATENPPPSAEKAAAATSRPASFKLSLSSSAGPSQPWHHHSFPLLSKPDSNSASPLLPSAPLPSRPASPPRLPPFPSIDFHSCATSALCHLHARSPPFLSRSLQPDSLSYQKFRPWTGEPAARPASATHLDCFSTQSTFSVISLSLFPKPPSPIHQSSHSGNRKFTRHHRLDSKHNFHVHDASCCSNWLPVRTSVSAMDPPHLGRGQGERTGPSVGAVPRVTIRQPKPARTLFDDAAAAYHHVQGHNGHRNLDVNERPPRADSPASPKTRALHYAQTYDALTSPVSERKADFSRWGAGSPKQDAAAPDQVPEHETNVQQQNLLTVPRPDSDYLSSYSEKSAEDEDTSQLAPAPLTYSKTTAALTDDNTKSHESSDLLDHYAVDSESSHHVTNSISEIPSSKVTAHGLERIDGTKTDSTLGEILNAYAHQRSPVKTTPTRPNDFSQFDFFGDQGERARQVASPARSRFENPRSGPSMPLPPTPMFKPRKQVHDPGESLNASGSQSVEYGDTSSLLRPRPSRNVHPSPPTELPTVGRKQCAASGTERNIYGTDSHSSFGENRLSVLFMTKEGKTHYGHLTFNEDDVFGKREPTSMAHIDENVPRRCLKHESLVPVAAFPQRTITPGCSRFSDKGKDRQMQRTLQAHASPPHELTKVSDESEWKTNEDSRHTLATANNLDMSSQRSLAPFSNTVVHPGNSSFEYQYKMHETDDKRPIMVPQYKWPGQDFLRNALTPPRPLNEVEDCIPLLSRPMKKEEGRPRSDDFELEALYPSIKISSHPPKSSPNTPKASHVGDQKLLKKLRDGDHRMASSPLGSENSYSGFTNLGANKNITGTPQGSRMKHAGSSLVGSSSPAAVVAHEKLGTPMKREIQKQGVVHPASPRKVSPFDEYDLAITPVQTPPKTHSPHNYVAVTGDGNSRQLQEEWKREFLHHSALDSEEKLRFTRDMERRQAEKEQEFLKSYKEQKRFDMPKEPRPAVRNQRELKQLNLRGAQCAAYCSLPGVDIEVSDATRHWTHPGLRIKRATWSKPALTTDKRAEDEVTDASLRRQERISRYIFFGFLLLPPSLIIPGFFFHEIVHGWNINESAKINTKWKRRSQVVGCISFALLFLTALIVPLALRAKGQ